MQLLIFVKKKKKKCNDCNCHFSSTKKALWCYNINKTVYLFIHLLVNIG